MIDLSFLTEAEQEAILKVLNRDAELKKAEEERVKHLQDVVDDENEYKYKSGQWFYEAKSKRHREKIHGADLVRASIRKRKKPATIAELSELNKDGSKRRWINNINQDIFIPPELYGVMEAPDEAEEDVLQTKQEGNQSSKKVSFTSPGKDKEQDNLRNGTLSPPKPRQNPFNSEGLQDDTQYNNKTSTPNHENVQINGTERPKSGGEPLYAVVNKTPAASSPRQDQDFDLDDALMEPRFHGQRGKTQNIYQNEKLVEFGKSFGGEGKMAYESSYSSKSPKENNRFSGEERLTPERARNTETAYSNDDPVESVAYWRRPFMLENQEPRRLSSDSAKEQKTSILQEYPGVYVKAEDIFSKTHPENQPSKTTPGKYSKETKYKSVFLQNRHDAEPRPVGLTVAQNVAEPFKPSGHLDKSLLYEENERKDMPRSAHFKVMSLKDRMNEMPREQMSNPSQFQSLKHFWNVEEKNVPRGTAVTSPDKILMQISSRNNTTRSDPKQRSPGIPADEVLIPNTMDSLSEEEQTSQKVASWLAQTPTVYGQIDQNEDPFTGEEIVEHVQKTKIHKKPDADFANALEKLREEALEIPKTTETAITISPISKNLIETNVPAKDLQTTDRGFYTRVIQISNKQSPTIESLEVEPKSKPIEANVVNKTIDPEKSFSEFPIHFEKLNSGKKVQTESTTLPNVKSGSVAEEVIEKSSVPKSQDQQDFISALKRLEIEASKPLVLPDVDYEDEQSEQEISQNIVSPVKSSFKNRFEHFGSDSDGNDFETPSKDHSVEYQPQYSYVPNKEPVTESTNQLEETIEKSTVPNRKDNEDLHVALRKLELEAIEHPSDDEFVVGVNQEVKFAKPEQVGINQEVKFEKPESLSDLSEDHSDINPSRRSETGQTDTFEEQEKLPVAEETISATKVESQESSADFHNRLMRLEEQAMIPEEPEDLLLDDTVKVSQVPNREVVISKKVFSSAESMPTLVENSSESGKTKEVDLPRSQPKDLNDLRSHDSSHYEELAKYSHSPQTSGSYYTGNGDMLYEKPEVGSPEVSNSKQGKPAESPKDLASLKNDKYEYEVMKAQDESISKVLDWFSRSSEMGDSPSLPVDVLQPSKESSSQVQIPISVNEKESELNEKNAKTEPTTYPESPKIVGKPNSSLSVIHIQNEDNSDIQSIEPPATISLMKVNSIPPEQLISEETPLQYGKSVGGSGKISYQGTKSLQDNRQYQEANYLDTFEEDKSSEEEHKDTIKDPTPVAESVSNQEISEMVEKPHSRLSLSSTDTSNDQSHGNEETLMTQVGSIENASPPRLIDSNIEGANCLEFGKSGGGSGKTSSPGHEISDIEKRRPSLSLSSRESTDHEQSDDLLTPVHVMEEELVPPKNLNPEDKNSLEFGASGCGSGKMSNQAMNNLEIDSQPQEVKDLFDKSEELKLEKESEGFLKEEALIPKDKGETPKTGKAPVSEAGPQESERKDMLDVSANRDSVREGVRKRSVNDIKQFWEGDRAAVSRSSSVDSDDRNSPSLVTFKKVMVEEEENSLPPINQLKSFWENEKYREEVNAKPPDSSLVNISSLDEDQVPALDSKPKFKKRHTFHSYLEKEQNATSDKNPPNRSISLSETTNDDLKGCQKSTTFQNLRSFWNVDNKAKSKTLKPNDSALSDSKNRQFRSNPDLSKQSFVAKIKSKLDSQSLEDIREDTPTGYQVQPVKEVRNRKNINFRAFAKQKSNNDDPSNSVEVQEKDYNPPNSISVSAETQIKSKPPIDNRKDVSEFVVKSSQRKRGSEFSLRLQKLRDELSDEKAKGGCFSVNSECIPTNALARGDLENKVLTDNLNGDKMHEKEHEQKPVCAKQIVLDAAKSSVDAIATPSPINTNGNESLKDGTAQINSNKEVNETVESTLVPPPKHSGDFDRGLQKLYNEFLQESAHPDVKLSQKPFINIQSPEENYSKVLTVSSSKNKSSPQSSSKEGCSPFQQPIVISLSSKKMYVDNEGAFSPPSQSGQGSEDNVVTSSSTDPQKDAPVTFETSTVQKNIDFGDETEPSKGEIALAQKQSKKEIVERIEMPTLVPRAPFNYFDEGLKKLYEESRASNTFQALPVKENSVMNEIATSASRDIEEETGETIGKGLAATKTYHDGCSEPLYMPSHQVTSEESQPRFSERNVVEGCGPPIGKAASVEDLQNEEGQEYPSRTNSTFTAMRQSTPVKEKDSSMRRSTLELYLEVPYRKEMSKSMDFELGGFTSDFDNERYQLNSSNPTEVTSANTFPQNADTLKRLSQSVPTFLQDETDGRDTDSASESSFQIGRHKKSPSSLTNLSGSSGMASMSSVSGSVMSIYSGDFGNVDIKGGIEFSIDYVEQLKEFLIYIYQCRELASADVKKQRSDPYVKAYLLPEKAKMGKRKTAVKKKTLNPVYNEILRYKIPKQSLLAQTLNLSVWHHDALGRNSFLGEVNVNLGTWDWSNTQRTWYQLEPRTPAAGIGLENRGEMKLSLKYIPMSSSGPGTKPNTTGEVYIWIKECLQLPMLRENKINSFVKCTVLPDTSRKSRQKTRTVDKTPSPIFNHTMVYDGFKAEDLKEACVELTVWDHNRLSNHFLGGLRIGLGTGKSYGTAVDWMDSTHEESTMWEKMMASPNTWIDGLLPLRMFKMAKLTK